MSNIEIFENERASNYDQFVGVWIPGYQRLIDLLPNLIGPAVPSKQDQLLVVGAGTGNEMKAIAKADAGWKITGVDPSPDMIKIARTKLHAFASISLYEGTVEHLPATTLYDAATLFLVLHFLPDDGSKLALLKNISTRLKPNASLYVLDIFGTPEEMHHNLGVLKKFVPAHLSSHEVDERIERIKQKIQYISEARLTEL
ncbi:MAG: class I SAM-dependent methyltransferase, partial [Bacteroidota bacterium]